jgi:hypothetical protein
VDKIDYLLRDSASIGEPCPDFLSRLLDNIRGLNGSSTFKEHLVLCTRSLILSYCGGNFTGLANFYFVRAKFSVGLFYKKEKVIKLAVR